MTAEHRTVLVNGYAVRSVRFTPYEIEPDRALRGAAEIFTRARAWGHLPETLTFEDFVAVLERRDDPFIGNAPRLRCTPDSGLAALAARESLPSERR